MSFSFNLDLNTIDNDVSSDSDGTGLQIDVAEVDNFNGTNRIRRQVVDDTSFINEIEEEIERQLGAKAAKTNLTATNVKNILKHVISNEHVMAMVHKKLTKGDEEIIFEPKLTRAKAKELAIAQPDIPWPITPVKSNTSEVQILIQEEFPEDSSDEEYDPNQDQLSDDDKDIDNLTGSDINCQPNTPLDFNDASTPLNKSSTPVRYDKEGVFKIPQIIPDDPPEKESIGQRTRSKLCLSETPLEEIEQAFIPPDITDDMYDWDWEPQDEYISFLKELYTQPFQKEINIDDDPEADPEYNILEDEETELLDKEELREDKAVKVSKKELKTLIAELGEFADQYTKQQQEQEQKVSRKKKVTDTSYTSVGNISPSNPMVVLLPVLAEPEFPELVNDSQRHLLSIQMAQHVQLMVQQFVMTYKHPKWHAQSQICKSNLNSLSTLGDRPDSKFMAQNLSAALKLVSDCELKFSDPSFLEEYIAFLKAEIEMEQDAYDNRRKYYLQFHPEIIKLMAESESLMHPQLLPDSFPTSVKMKGKLPYLLSEENLIALGLEQFVPYVETLPKKFKRKSHILIDAIQLVQKYLLPIKNVSGMSHHIEKRRLSKIPNPIKQYFTTGFAPRIEHCILNQYQLIAPKYQPIELLPPIWQDFVNNLQNGNLEKLILLSKPLKTNKISYEDKFVDHSYDDILINRDHELLNPMVNMLRHMPSLMTPQKEETNNTISKNSNAKVICNSKINETESDAESAESLKACETDEEESKPPRLRRNTPRLAKIKSAQNMKLLAQLQSSKGSTSNSNVNENKEYNFDKNYDDDESSFTKGDNEDEIAELMLASTTIKKNTANRRKNKQTRELENLKRLLEAINNINEDERATKYAASFLHKIHVQLESKDPELFKAVLKIFLDYSEKIENHTSDNYFLNKAGSSSYDNMQVRKGSILDKDDLSITLYQEVCNKLHEYPDLCSDFLSFLTPHQAALINKSAERTMTLKMHEFINVTQMYFVKQPSRIAKVMQAVTEMASDPYIKVDTTQSIMGLALKGHPLIMDMFLQVIPTGKPPDSLFAAHMFENLSCPVGPHDKNKPYDAHAPELYENIELPVSTPQEDPYGGDSCKCDCHNLTDDLKLKGINEHCASCGTRFLNGRIYLQTSEGLRPAKIIFPGADDEKLENISRVSLKQTERFIPGPPPRKRRKSAKRDSISEEYNVKSCLSKVSPVKDNEDNDRSTLKSKRGTRSPLKSTDQKKMVKVSSISLRNKKEKRIEKKDMKCEQKTEDDVNECCRDQVEFEECNGNNATEDYVESDPFSCKFGEVSTDSHDDETMTSPEKMNVSSTSIEKLDASSDSDSSTKLESEIAPVDTVWTMHDDKILLENLQKDYSEKSFHVISLLLNNRTAEQVKERCKYLLSLIEKMA